MNIEQLYEFCLSKKGVTEHFPFDEETLFFKVGGKMFCLTSLKKWEEGDHSINLKCDPEKAIELRAQYEAINPGYYMSKIHWNTVDVEKDLPLKEVVKLVEHSYDLVFKSLSKKIQNEILELEN
jgi:predicted DNA-binding protein (MmcQ/YjbR family)